MGEIIYSGRDNTIAMQLVDNDTPLTPEQMSAITAVDLTYLGVTIRSSELPSVFDWSTRASEGIIIIAAGGVPDIAPGTDLSAKLIVYSPEYPNGIVWGSFVLKISPLD